MRIDERFADRKGGSVNNTGSLFIKFESENNSFDLIALSNSFKGLNTTIEELFKISKIDGELKIDVKQIKPGSILSELGFIITVGEQAFHRMPDLIDFIKIASPIAYQEACRQLSEQIFDINNTYHSAEEFWRNHSLLTDLGTLFGSVYIPRMIEKARLYKRNAISEENDIPEVYAEKLHKMISDGKFKKIVEPIKDNSFDRIVVSGREDFSNPAVIDNDNFEDYLSEEEQILPEWIDGQERRLTGEIVALQSMYGDKMKVRIDQISSVIGSLVAYPPEDKQTREFRELYNEKVNIKANIIRKSMYKNPELGIVDITRVQERLDLAYEI